MRKFDTGATRNTDAGKIDYDGFISPYALKAFTEYMHKHRVQADGNIRESDNWQKGIPLEAYRKSGWRHWIDVWYLLKGLPAPRLNEDGTAVDLVEALCGLMFNVQGILHEVVKEKEAQQ